MLNLVSPPHTNQEKNAIETPNEVLKSSSSSKRVIVEISDEETEIQTPIDKSIQSNLLAQKTEPSFTTNNEMFNSTADNDLIFNQYQSRKYPEKGSISLIEEDNVNYDKEEEEEEKESLVLPSDVSTSPTATSTIRMKKKLDFVSHDKKKSGTPSSNVCQEYLHDCVDYEREGNKTLTKGQEKLLSHIRSNMCIPVDFEINKTYGSLSGLSYEERLIRAFFNKKLLPKSVKAQDEHSQWVTVLLEYTEESDLEIVADKENKDDKYQKLFKDLYHICRTCGEKGHLYDYCTAESN